MTFYLSFGFLFAVSDAFLRPASSRRGPAGPSDFAVEQAQTMPFGNGLPSTNAHPRFGFGSACNTPPLATGRLLAWPLVLHKDFLKFEVQTEGDAMTVP